MWILLMIVFNQPYQVDYISILGNYSSRTACKQGVDRALYAYSQSKNSASSSFGCVKVGHVKAITRR